MIESDFLFVQNFINQRSGIVINNEKRYLIETRLEPLARQLALPSLEALVAKLKLREPLVEISVIDALTTNETLFFRDKQPFEVLREAVLPKLVKSRRAAGSLRIWSAACSSGQEAYSIAMILEEMRLQVAGMKIEIIATDISERIVDQAKKGVYSQFEVQRGLPVRLLLQHFTQEGTRWRINPALGRNISFRAGNLLQPFRHLGMFDLILCRNVMIYFAEATKRDVLKRLSECLAADGSLMLGGAETVLGLCPALAPHQTDRSVYVHADSPEAHRIGERRMRLTA
jgi:chemotaxis protein methyltransferase CheR